MFPKICTTHTYDDRLETLHIARKAGLELCTGGIIGMGETRKQRLELALELAKIRPEEVTVNNNGTPLQFQTPLDAQTLHDIGVRRYNHNLETSRSMFPKICTTHTYDDRLETLHIARKAGLELCTGGIIGMGETRKQRLELALELAKIRPEEVTVNILVPMPGTPLQFQTPLDATESARMFAVLRFLLPHSIIKISGGREKAFEDDGASLLRGGANGIITAGYLTTDGNDPEKDSKMIEKAGLGQ